MTPANFAMKLSKSSVIQMDDHQFRQMQEECVRMVTLLSKYRNFTKQFVFSCKCPRNAQESLQYGSQFQELDYEFKELMSDLGHLDEPLQVLTKKTPLQSLPVSQPTPHEVQVVHHARLQQQQQQQVLNESPQLQPPPPPPQSQQNHHNGVNQSKPQQQMSFANSNTTNNLLISHSSGSSSTSSSMVANHHLTNHQQQQFVQQHLQLLTLPRSQSEPLTTTITLSDNPDDHSQSPVTLETSSTGNLQNQHLQAQPSLVQLNEQLYIKSIQGQNQHQLAAQQLSPNTSAMLINQIKAAQQNGHHQIALHHNSTATFPIIQNTSNEPILIRATPANLSKPISIVSTQALSSHIASHSSSAGETSSLNNNNQTRINPVSQSQAGSTLNLGRNSVHLLPQPQSNSMHGIESQTTGLLKLVDGPGGLTLAPAASANNNVAHRSNLIATIASTTSNGIEHLTTSSSHIRIPTSSINASGPISVNHVQQPQHIFQTVDQLEAAQFSPGPPLQSQSQSRLNRPSSDSPIFIKNVPSSSVVTSSAPAAEAAAVSSAAAPAAAPTLSVIHPNQAYILSHQSLAHAQTPTTPQKPPTSSQTIMQQQQNHHKLHNTSEAVQSANHLNNVGSPASPAPSVQLQQQPLQPQSILVYPSGSSTPTTSSQHALILKRKLKLANGDTFAPGTRVIIATTNTPEQTRQLDVVKTLPAANLTPVVSMAGGALAAASVVPESFVTNLSSTSPDTPLLQSTPVTTTTLNLSSSSASSSSSSINSLIAKTILANQSSPELANFVLNSSGDSLSGVVASPSTPASTTPATTSASAAAIVVQEDPEAFLVGGGFTPDANGQWRCTFADCGFSSGSKSVFVAHIRKAHQVSRPFKCLHPGCSATFKEKYKLKVHSVVHTGEKPFSCDWPGCMARFSQSGHVSRHRKTHMGQAKFTCNWPGCSRAFIQKHTLKYHLMMHKGEKPWICDIDHCGRSFIEKWKLVKHQKSHNRNSMTGGVVVSGAGVVVNDPQKPSSTVLMVATK